MTSWQTSVGGDSDFCLVVLTADVELANDGRDELFDVRPVSIVRRRRNSEAELHCDTSWRCCDCTVHRQPSNIHGHGRNQADHRCWHSSVGMRLRTDSHTGRQTHRHTHAHTQTRVTNIHFASSTTHADVMVTGITMQADHRDEAPLCVRKIN